MYKKPRFVYLLPILSIFIVGLLSIWATLPVANAISSSKAFDFNHYTARFPGGQKICGAHICAPGEYEKMQESLTQAQLKGPGYVTPALPITPTMPITPSVPITKQGQNVTQVQNMTLKPSMIPQNNLTAETKDLGSVLKLSNTNLPLTIPLSRGLYDGKDVFYITTEASDLNIASSLTKFTKFPVTFAPALAKTPDQSLAQIFVFKNGIKGLGVLGYQPNVVDSIPTQSGYSPLWQMNFVEWKNPTNATVLKSYNEIEDAVTNGMVIVSQTNVVVNCPIIQWSGNGIVPAGHMKIREDPVLTDTTPYGDAQVLDINTQKMEVTFVAHRGFAPDGSTMYYIATDSSNKDQSDLLGLIFTNKTQATITTSSSSDLYQFSNGIKGAGPLGFQSGVGATKLKDQFYSPMWRIQIIAWKDQSSATVLENTHDIRSKGDQITTVLAGFVVNCPFFSADTVFAQMK